MSRTLLAGVGGFVVALIASAAIWGLTAWLWIAGFFVALYVIAGIAFTDRRRPDEIHCTTTADGWTLGIWRYRPRGERRRHAPVVLLHGLGANQRNFDLEDRYSVALYLANAGYDCFLPALRGCGPSARRRWGYPDKWNINFDKFVEFDVPAVFDKVRELTGAPQLHLVAQSMGAMIGYAIAEGELGARLKSYVAFNGPCFFAHMQQFAAMAKLRWALKPLLVVHSSVFARIQSIPADFWPAAIGRDEVNPDNVDGPTIARAAVNLVTDMPRDLLFQFAKWIEDREFGSERPESWEKNLHKITVPIYCLGGPVDFFCVPDANRGVVDKVGSAKKKYRLFSKANGDLADYGHGDLTVGRTAPTEVFPTVLEWIDDND